MATSAVTTASPASTPTTSTSIPSAQVSWNGHPPLTTPWSLPESVTCHHTYDPQHTPPDGGTTAWLDWAVDPGATTFSCYPPGMFENGNSGTFSPASCPMGWYTVDESTALSPMAVTTRTCCSQEYTLRGGYCLRAQPTVLAVPVTHLTAGSHVYLTETSTLLVNATLAHRRIVVMFTLEDEKLLGMGPGDDLMEEKGEGPKGMSVGVKVGISIGAAVIFSLLVLLLFFLVKWRATRLAKRHRRRRSYELGAHGRGSCSRGSSSTSREIYTAEQGVTGGRLEVTATTRETDPPPIYEATRKNASASEVAIVDPASPEEELQVLKAQQAEIQRRIEEIEKEAK